MARATAKAIIISDSQEKAEALNMQCTPQFTRDSDDDLPEIDDNPGSPMQDILFTVTDIEKLLSNLNPSKASGPDLLPTSILKWYRKKLPHVLCAIYQQSCNTGQVHLDWHQANVSCI